jgi:hypothetical protein
MSSTELREIARKTLADFLQGQNVSQEKANIAVAILQHDLRDEVNRP